jgi:endonuclease/exonuclease/phosphatase family metal-dependent hydrolase
MRVVSWNLGYAFGFKGTHERAWRYLEALDPDLALLQEVHPPDWAVTRKGWTMVPGRFTEWGSVILAKTFLQLTPFQGPIEGRLEAVGYLATGTVTLPDGASLLVGSVHTPIGTATQEDLGGRDAEALRRPSHKQPPKGPYRNDVAYAIYRDRVPERFLVSGDWNCSPFLWDALHRGEHEAEFFDRARDDGWMDCYQRFHPEGEGRTWFRGSEPPYQMDHAFCDGTTAEALVSCAIDAHPAGALGLSDHAPLFLEFKP